MSPFVPNADAAVALLKEYFFCRADHVAVLSRNDRPMCVRPRSPLDLLLRTHLLGESAAHALVDYRSHRGRATAFRGHFRVGSYSTSPDGNVAWLCIDLDGPGHASALADPKRAALRIVAELAACGVPAYVECSGGGLGWHVWVFFSKPVPAKLARELAFHAIPADVPLLAGGLAEPTAGLGIEVFPKQDHLRSLRSIGNMVWLPWWWRATPGGNLFYREVAGGQLEPFVPERFDRADAKRVEEAVRVAEATRAEAPKRVSLDEAWEAAPLPTGPVDSAVWVAWRREAVSRLPLESVYGPWLTGLSSGEGWLECRDPASPSGDQSPSAGVADGGGEAPRGTFHSFRTGRSVSVFDFLIEQRIVAGFPEALRRISELSGVSLPGRSQRTSAAAGTVIASVPAGGASSSSSARPAIQINQRGLDRVVADAWCALLAANRGPSVFLQAGHMARLRRGGLRRIWIELMDDVSLGSALASAARWVRVGQDVEIETFPLKEVAKDMLATPHGSLPELEAILTTPVFGKDGRLINVIGYHQEDKVWFEPVTPLEIREIPDEPSREDIEESRNRLTDDLLGDFPFVRPSDRAHAISALVLPFARRLMTGCTPLHLVEAPEAGSGKGLFSTLVSVLATGAPADGRTIPDNEDEVRKMLTAELVTGRPVILLDNADDRKGLHSPAIASVLSSETRTDRLLGQSRMVTSANTATWILTGNNVQLSKELARRCIRIRLDPGVSRPWLRDASKFRHPRLVEWAMANRAELVRSVLVLIQAWIAAGRPEQHRTVLGTFESWSAIVGGILDVVGVPGFLENQNELYENADSSSQEWHEFAAAWWEEHRDRAVRVAELTELCESRELLVSLRGDGNPKSQQSRLGRALVRARDRVFDGRRVTRLHIHGAHKGGFVYALRPAEGEAALAAHGDGGEGLGIATDDESRGDLTAVKSGVIDLASFPETEE